MYLPLCEGIFFVGGRCEVATGGTPYSLISFSQQLFFLLFLFFLAVLCTLILSNSFHIQWTFVSISQVLADNLLLTIILLCLLSRCPLEHGRERLQKRVRDRLFRQYSLILVPHANRWIVDDSAPEAIPAAKKTSRTSQKGSQGQSSKAKTSSKNGRSRVT